MLRQERHERLLKEPGWRNKKKIKRHKFGALLSSPPSAKYSFSLSWYDTRARGRVERDFGNRRQVVNHNCRREEEREGGFTSDALHITPSNMEAIFLESLRQFCRILLPARGFITLGSSLGNVESSVAPRSLYAEFRRIAAPTRLLYALGWICKTASGFLAPRVFIARVINQPRRRHFDTCKIESTE